MVNKKSLMKVVAIIVVGIVPFAGCKAKVEVDKGSYPQLNLSEDKFLNSVDSERAMKHINNLSVDIGERVASSENEQKGAKYIEEEFKRMGYEVNINDTDYSKYMGEDNGKFKTANVVARRVPEGNDKDDSKDIVYVTAHYDSVKTSPGANDNASGVAAMLEIAEIIKDLDIDKEIRFVAFGAEELGLIGSMDYVKSINEVEKKNIIGCFNLDMVATAYEPATELGIYTFDGKENAITDAVKKSGVQLESLSNEKVSYDGLLDDDFGSSDHQAFSMNNIPAALFINVVPNKKNSPRQALEPYYHTPEDNIQNVSKERLERTIKLVGRAIYDVVDIEN